MATVLAIDDEPFMLGAVARGLASFDHDVLVARSARDGLAAAAAQNPDVVVLDLLLPDLHGLEFIRRLRAWSNAPILAMADQQHVQHRVAALDEGADDVLTKPFALDELRARIDAALRRTTSDSRQPVIEAHDVTIDLATRSVARRGCEIRVTPTQWHLMELLISHAGTVVSYDDIIRNVWGARHGDEVRASLRVHMRQLRHTLGDRARQPRFIRTEPQIGYRWIGPAPDRARSLDRRPTA